MREADRAERLLDAAVAILGREGDFTDEPSAKLVTCRIGDLSLRLRGVFKKVAGRFEMRAKGHVAGRVAASGWESRYVLEIDAPVSVFAVAWGGGDPIDVRLLIRGGWEGALLEAAGGEADPVETGRHPR